MKQASRPVLAFWCRIPSRPNFGDALTPWLIRRITGRTPHFALPEDPRDKLFVTGSILAFATARCTVWGSGVMNADDHVSPAARLLAVRGPLSGRRARACGADCPEVYGDPALLLPRFLPPPALKRKGPSLVAHFSDLARLGGRVPPGLVLIDIQAGIEEVVAQICRSEWVLSSSLHGLIVSHAYGVPAAWVSFRDLPSGDGSKFHDHYAALGVEPPSAAHLADDCAGFASLASKAWSPASLDTEALWRSCPFRQAACRENGDGD
ncbi:polysaccharide pyruvyl transferase family protein [Methylocystis sp. H62]|uniref:polysaccharide pyruvyl transferase family protein n=1 Tax=Methylocystis sp. H62 TaxID=2785789 RepID=UPI0018C1EB88|nr:polysaccharide pyruvyl transferase family protein [Methylocystis sp. H62]MBG0794475.1 polysaccharide pyruvyl transferase family protein [Methylocystis sp. H62]